MNIDKDLILKLAHLSRLNVSDEAINGLTEKFTNVVHLLEKLNNLDLDSVEETLQVTGLNNVTQPDLVSLCETEKQLLACSSQPVEKNMITISRVVK